MCSSDLPVTKSGDLVDLYNLKLTFNHDIGINDFETGVSSKTAYVKYGEAGLYTDDDYAAGFTIPAAIAASGYRLYDDSASAKYWANTVDTTSYFNAEEIAAKTFTNDDTFTATSMKQWVVTVDCDTNGSFVNFTSPLTVDTGKNLSEIGLPTLTATGSEPKIVPATGYVFSGWYQGDKIGRAHV